MEWMLVVLVLVFFFAPIVLSIIAMARTSRLTQEVERLRRAMLSTLGEPAARAPVAQPIAKPEAPKPVTAEPPPMTPSSPAPAPVQRPVLPPPVASKSNMEVTIGGKIASFVGIAALVAGIVFFVGYAIQRQLLGPGMRIVLGLLAGGVLVAAGHFAESSGKNLRVLARALTGGGAALFYFSVFAAYGIYHLIPASLAGLGLVASAVAVLALAAAYNSQVVAVLGVLGAYISPLLIGGDLSEGSFALFFIAVVNVPVLALGLKRKWQWLYNIAFVFTVVIAGMWIDEEVFTRSSPWAMAMAFCLIYFGEFVALGVLKLKDERATTGRVFDVARLALCSVALLGATYWILDEIDANAWMGAALLAGAALHVGLAKAAWRWLPQFKDEILVFLVGALTFAALALPAQLDGVWVSLGWAIEGVILAWFGVRVQSRFLQALAIGLGSMGLLKSLAYDVTLYGQRPKLFFNGRFAVGMISGALLSAQAWFHGRAAAARQDKLSHSSRDPIMAWAVIALIAVVFGDAFYTLDIEDPLAALVTTFAMMMAGTTVLLRLRDDTRTILWGVGAILLLLAPAKLIFFDLWWSWEHCHTAGHAFANTFFWCNAVMIGVIVSFASSGLLSPRGAGAWVAPSLNVTSLVGMMALVSVEIWHARTPWNDSLVTLWWAVAAMAVAVVGFMRRRKYLRVLALVVFAVTAAKVVLVDLHELSGLHRVAAFMGVGVLLLVLSFIYQRVAPMLQKQDDDRSGEKS